MIIRFEGRTICLWRERFISRLSLVTLCNGRICIGMCETFFFPSVSIVYPPISLCGS